MTSPYSSAPRALIEDLTESNPTNPSYFVVAVDGKPARRMEGDMIDPTPCVVVTPGNHTLNLEQRTGESPKSATISSSFQAGKRYRIKDEDGEPVIAEAPDPGGWR
jgi:hypothetical protein